MQNIFSGPSESIPAKKESIVPRSFAKKAGYTANYHRPCTHTYTHTHAQSSAHTASGNSTSCEGFLLFFRRRGLRETPLPIHAPRALLPAAPRRAGSDARDRQDFAKRSASQCSLFSLSPFVSFLVFVAFRRSARETLHCAKWTRLCDPLRERASFLFVSREIATLLTRLRLSRVKLTDALNSSRILLASADPQVGLEQLECSTTTMVKMLSCPAIAERIIPYGPHGVGDSPWSAYGYISVDLSPVHCHSLPPSFSLPTFLLLLPPLPFRHRQWSVPIPDDPTFDIAIDYRRFNLYPSAGFSPLRPSYVEWTVLGLRGAVSVN